MLALRNELSRRKANFKQLHDFSKLRTGRVYKGYIVYERYITNKSTDANNNMIIEYDLDYIQEFKSLAALAERYNFNIRAFQDKAKKCFDNNKPLRFRKKYINHLHFTHYEVIESPFTLDDLR